MALTHKIKQTLYEPLRLLLHGQVNQGHECVLNRIRREPDERALGPYAYNPALISTGDNRRVCVFRRISPSGTRELCLAPVTDSLEIDPSAIRCIDAQLSTSDLSGPFEDARHFRYQDVDYLIYHSNRSLYIVPFSLSEGRRLAPPRLLVQTVNGVATRLDVEKNWTLFEADGEVHVIYSIDPFRILKPVNWDEEGTPLRCEFLAEHTPGPSLQRHVRNPFGWKRRDFWNTFHWGRLRGGAPPARIGDHFFLFAHSYSYVKHIGSYSLFGFSAQPPFRITHYPKRPIGFPTIENARSSRFYPGLFLVFPCSAHYEPTTDEWLVACGRDDYCMEFISHRHSRILETCQSTNATILHTSADQHDH